jgi:DNA-binding transcriptional LysR family regulator
MTIKQLHYFVAVAETLSFTQAAKRFFVAQTAVSQQIASLEKELDLQLFRRNNRHVELTEAGQRLYQEVRPLVIRLEDAVRTAAAVNRKAQPAFRLGVTPEVPAHRLPPLLAQFHQLHPELSLNLQRDEFHDLAQPLKNGDLDAAIMVGPNNLDPRLVAAVPLAGSQPPFLLAVAPGSPFYDLDEVAWEALAGHPLILSRDTAMTPGFGDVEPQILRLNAMCPMSHSADSIEGVLTLVEAGLGVGVLPSAAFGRVKAPLRLLRPVPCPAAPDLAVYHHRNNSRPALADFLQLCQENFCSC